MGFFCPQNVSIFAAVVYGDHSLYIWDIHHINKVRLLPYFNLHLFLLFSNAAGFDISSLVASVAITCLSPDLNNGPLIIQSL